MPKWTRRESMWALAVIAALGFTARAEDAPKPETDAETKAEADDKDEPKEAPTPSLTNVRLIFKDLPRELSPHPREGWDKYTKPKVLKWLTETWVGRKVHLTRRLHSVSVRDNVYTKTPEDEFAVTITPKFETFPFRGRQIEFMMGQRGFPAYQFTFIGDEAFAKRCERMPANKILTITGTIEDVGFSRGSSSTHVRLHLKLRDCSIPELN